MSTPTLAFVDTETTGLDPWLHDAWEIAVILRRDGQDDAEHVYRIEPDLNNADPKALEINRYHERTTATDWQWDNRQTATHELYDLLNGAVMLGSNAPFDAKMLCHLFGRYYAQPEPWHYRVIDVPTVVAGYLWGRAAQVADTRGDWPPLTDDVHEAAVDMPWSSRRLSLAMAVELPGSEAHEALPDARWMRDLWDTVALDPERAAAPHSEVQAA